MKYILILFIIISVSKNCKSLDDKKDATMKDRNFYDVMRDLMAFISNTQKNANQFNFDKYGVNINTTALQFDAFLSEIILSGFSSFDYSFIQLGPSSGTNNYTFSISMSYNELKFISNHYRLNMNILSMLPIYGEGRGGILLGNFKSILNVTLSQTKGGYLNIEELDTDFDIKTIKTAISGLLNTEAQSDLISTVLSFILPTVVRDIKPWLLMVANPAGNYAINHYLMENKITLETLIKLVESYIGPSL